MMVLKFFVGSHPFNDWGSRPLCLSQLVGTVYQWCSAATIHEITEKLAQVGYVPVTFLKR